MAAGLAAAALATYWVVGEHREPLPPRPTYTGAAAVVERFECYRCHDAPGVLEPAHRERSCVRCHREVLSGELDAVSEPEVVAAWKRNIVSLTDVPSLTGIDRFRREWLVAFLRSPHDLRPELGAAMPRMQMTAEEAEQIAAFFIPDSPSEESHAASGDVERGRALFEARACGQCHHYGGSGVVGSADHDDARLAPDLRFTRERMTRARTLAWLADPVALKSDTPMPPPNLDASERRDVAAFLFDLELDLEEAPTESAESERLPLLEREVRFAEVDARVFHRVCRHCHGLPSEENRNDGGPGYSGGFGFAPREIDLSSYEGIRQRPELLAPDESGAPLLVAALRRRHDEVRGVNGERRGMPLGLPPLSPEDIQLVETWIAGGARR